MAAGSGHRISKVEEGSYAWEMGVMPGMYLVSVNGQTVEDVFDYRFLMLEEHIEVLIREENGDETLVSVDKDADEDFGVEFESGLMDDCRSCCNRCIFCFIDQMPKGMRSTLYFKDDDSRLSFLQGNYVTLTNMSDHDIDRIIRYRMEPINISVHTTNPELRVKMLKNRFAGRIFPKMQRLKDARIAMNGQIVLCKGWNDGAELDRTIRDLTAYLPEMQSVSVVPVGLTRFRDNLTPLQPFTPEDASRVIDQIEAWQKRIWDSLAAAYIPEEGEEVPDLMRGAPRHFIHASDEWYILAGRELPPEENYDGFVQYENGVGMIRLQQIETDAAIAAYASRILTKNEQFLTIRPASSDAESVCGSKELQQDEDGGFRDSAGRTAEENMPAVRHTTAVSGLLAETYLRRVMERIEEAFPGHHADVAAIRNDFFGERITVTGLITGGDLIRQLKERVSSGIPIGDELLIPSTMLRRGEQVFLDDVTVDEVSRSLSVPVRVVWDRGEDLVRAVLGFPPQPCDERQIYEQ
ncbi:MAG: DUF512 domain-containing protein [Lachnospiraceae bacterium]|nr:DUF512 domain-containing protein [Lachnospiraceae bacterium]